ncbi:MAG: hypothetical protein INQ03_07490 [Candidatus Heimdallarchaeota archaeon]|nr:hypothetical protein [Candidatus Heimdallarchaeota archaeon]
MKPVNYYYSLKISEEYTLSMFIVEFENAIQVSIYDDQKIGSMVLSYPSNEIVSRQVIFSGRHESFANAVGQLLAHFSKKMVYSSVYLNVASPVSLDHIRSLIDRYKDNDNKKTEMK